MDSMMALGSGASMDLTRAQGTGEEGAHPLELVRVGVVDLAR